MKNFRGITINHDHDSITTEGLHHSKLGGELKIHVGTESLDGYFKLLKYIIGYILDYQPTIEPQQTISYHSWLLKFQLSKDNYLEIWEADKDGNGFVIGADYAIRIISDQEDECAKYGVTAIFPTFNQNVVISKGVYEGLGVDAVRYPSPNQMTGWWITTELYDDNVDSLMNVYYFHLAFRRPDLIKYLALPFGFRLYITEQEQEIWYDNEVMDE